MDLSKYELLPFNYPDVGATRGAFPHGYHHVRKDAAIGKGRATFDTAAEILMAWGMQRGAGMSITASTSRVTESATLVATLGPLVIPCRVVYVIDEPNRRGFAYGTLTGHPESGEELFTVEYLPGEDAVIAHIAAFSVAARWFTKLGGPLARVGQRLMTELYVRALKR